MVKAKPCDREAATKAGEEALRNVADLADYDHDAMIRHFAAHRKAAIAPLVEMVTVLQEALVQHNDQLRSAAAIANRDGKDTNWLTFRGAVHYTLAEYRDLVSECRAALQSLGENGK